PQRWCPTQGHIEIEEQLEGVRRRLALLNFADPEIAVVDNCCHVKAAILKVFPDIAVVLDVWHFVQRYLACVLGGTKNPRRSEVAQDITDAILKSKASDGNPATYWSQEEQERRLILAYEKWVEDGSVWSAAAEKVHADQLAHVKKGCLARPRDDIPSDGSRIEGSHKGWNGIQRSFASGLEALTYLAHDFVLRRNTRIEFASGAPSLFVGSTYGSHHVRLVNFLAHTWNDILLDIQKANGLPAGMTPLPTLEPAPSGETFGLVKMTAAAAAHYTFIKQEPEDDLLDLSSHVNPTSILDELGIDPKLAHLLPPNARLSKEVFATPSDLDPPVYSSQLPSPHDPSASPLGPSSSSSPVNTDFDDLSSSTSRKGKERATNAPVPSTPWKGRSAAPALWSAHRPSPSNIALLLSASTMAPRKTHRFFAPVVRDSVTITGHGNYHAPCLPIIRITGLTKSQQIFSQSTGLDPRSIVFTRTESEAFFLFMELRKEHQWATYKMSSRDYVTAATIYNHAVEKKNAAEGRALVRKTPRALLDKLNDVELAIIQRVSKGDYKSQSGTMKFWYQHCHAVPLRLLKPAERTTDPAGMELKNIGLSRRTPVCKRCKAIMYPGGEGCPQNHKRGVCSDGARTTTQTINRTVNGQSVQIHEEPPQWPQPAGIFKDGKKFNGRRFLAALEEMYERIVKKGDVDSERTMEYLALTSLLQSRLECPPATETHAAKALFRLFDGLELEDCPAELVVAQEGSRFLHINYLCQQPAMVSALGVGGSSSTSAF
ncbi:hypothetical protein C8T65DRAFT_567509, partial [Cerioporus squamosus]